jgi:hypothetical protein
MGNPRAVSAHFGSLGHSDLRHGFNERVTVDPCHNVKLQGMEDTEPAGSCMLPLVRGLDVGWCIDRT